MIDEKGYLNADLLNGESMTNVLTDSHNFVLKQVPDTSGSYDKITDKGQAGFDMDVHKIYLFINSHPFNKQLYLISGFNGNILKIVSQEENQTSFNYNSSQKKLYITSTGSCRGYLYELVGLAGS